MEKRYVCILTWSRNTIKQYSIYYVLNSRDHLQDLPLCYDRHLIKYLSDKLEKLTISFLNIVPPIPGKRVLVQSYSESSSNSLFSDASVPIDRQSPQEHRRIDHQGFVHVPWQGVLATRPIRHDDAIYQSCRIYGQQRVVKEECGVPSWAAQLPKRPKWQAGYPDSQFNLSLSDMSLPNYDVVGNPLPLCSETGAVVCVPQMPSRPRSWSGRDPVQLPVPARTSGSFYSRDLSVTEVIQPSYPWRTTAQARKPLFQSADKEKSHLGKRRSVEPQTSSALFQGDLRPEIGLHHSVSYKGSDETLRDGGARYGRVQRKDQMAKFKKRKKEAASETSACHRDST